MLLATRCPFCETVFRIQPQQLAARHGLVRCGHCQEAFDASGSLFDVPAGGDFSQASPVAAGVAASLTSAAAAATEPSPPPSASPAVTPPVAAGAPNFSNPSWNAWAPHGDRPADTSPRYSGDHLPQPSIAPGVTPQVSAGPAEPQLSAEAAELPPTTRWSRVEPEPAEPTLSSNEIPAPEPDAAEPHLSPAAAAGGGAGSTFADLPPSDGEAPFAMTREAPARKPRRTGWRIVGALVALLLLALLAAQAAWWLRETVMVYWPASQPLYEQACAKIGCRVLPPRDIDGLQVEPSDLRQVDDPHHLELKMPLRNHFNVALAYPAIELTLLDRQNNVVVRRVLWPQDYVPPGTRIDAGLPARSTQTMIVRLDTGNVVASNFRIEVFYP
ncbi:zinc-ribbon and DUF3426 domain-containing protein [Paraburkholderia caballeronis]|uniref:MJ0042 family finger-like domain-containing protein n=1 Tax=Paraburkholderia caballeronis TaxID=416943 RepID=A0A1H7PZR8_9BURK|nr:zinc-ribbon and DUF3426 domain-containing protein [Paraburkholderia caballeronis]PXW24418.1 putative Zn finger-like uncharacterized protein [Paraburkholderia caballeronis]PXX00200.1 putative Zn finger-like uncharacterized protein [Paraburkholderia caballeronis]RAJ97329.1 putative Zn finger-like uncharacterized protein [Paraburkholderia caballeronis]SEB63598.1 MJ0042 family finger-like domain-containing protein [Paraburkholderia caballeronis]SEL41086.1 MJ0042 family finger-like domain-contai